MPRDIDNLDWQTDKRKETQDSKNAFLSNILSKFIFVIASGAIVNLLISLFLIGNNFFILKYIPIKDVISVMSSAIALLYILFVSYNPRK